MSGKSLVLALLWVDGYVYVTTLIFRSLNCCFQKFLETTEVFMSSFFEQNNDKAEVWLSFT